MNQLVFLAQAAPAAESSGPKVTGPMAVGMFFGLMVVVSLLALTSSAVRRNTVLLATCLVIVTVAVCGSAIALALYYFISAS